MKIEQKQKFNPITITLETREEALLFWGYTDINETKNTERWGRIEAMSNQFSDWFRNNAKI